MRLEQLKVKLKQAGESNLTRVIAWGCLSWGVSKRVIRDYLEIFEDADLISTDAELNLVIWK